VLNSIFRTSRRVAVVGCFVLSLGSAQSLAAQEQRHLLMATGNDALTTCTTDSQDSIMAASICLAWTNGVRDGHYMTMMTLGFSRPMWCEPANVTNGQNRDIFVKFLRDNPVRRHENANLLFLDALMAAFPCQDSPSAD